MPSRVEDLGELVEHGRHQGGPVGVTGGLDPAGGLGAGVRVAVEADQPEAGVGVEHRDRVAGQAQGGVDQDGAVGGAGGGEEFGDALQEDRHVHRRRQSARRRGVTRGAHRRLPLERSVGIPAHGAARGGSHVGRRRSGERDRADGAGGAGGGAGRSGGGVGRSGAEGAEWGVGPSVRGGRPAPRGARLASGKSVRWCPAGAGGRPQGGHGAVRRAPLRNAVLRAVRNPVAGKATGARTRSSRGEGGSFGHGSRSSGGQRALSRRQGARDHDNVGIPSLSMSA